MCKPILELESESDLSLCRIGIRIELNWKWNGIEEHWPELELNYYRLHPELHIIDHCIGLLVGMTCKGHEKS